ncbi:MAG TPA: glycosyltransferase family 4 protein [Myxococcota bacterium]|nr:glycosyltransferase family 4 protein [Myxococcota bacterium]HRY97197.1 glycosyltransferase family 4 protein [Myxococcota bacterium]HSA21345.1 glycosyltransferase family 4 protein [Myxococcota bacterium]
MSALRVLHLTRDLPPATKGGISTAVHGLARASAGFGIEAAVASFDAWRPLARAHARGAQAAPAEERGLRVLRLHGPGDLPALAPFAEAFRPDLLHVHHGMLWEAATGLRARLGVPALKTVHVLQAELQRQRRVLRAGTNLSLAAQRRAVEEADAVHVPCADAARSLLRDHPRAEGRLHVLGFGLEDSEAARRAAARERPFAPRLLYAGRFAEVKGTGELLSAWPAVAGRVPGARLCLAGGLPGNRQGERRFRRRTAEREAAATGLEWPGWLAPEALAEEMARAELLCCPGWFETFDQSLLEGMLHGLPAVATAAGGHLELVADGITGLLVPPREPAALAEALGALLGQPALARRLGRAAADQARRRWLWERLGGAWGALYAAAVGRRP